MSAIELDRVEERIEEPAKGWRNKWRVITPDFVWAAGDITWGPVFPTKEIALQKAEEAKAHNARVAPSWGGPPPEHLGAFPVTP